MIHKISRITLLIFFLLLININSSSIKILQPRQNIKKMIDSLKFHHFDIDIRFPNIELFNNDKNNTFSINKIKQHLKKISLIINKLLFSNNKQEIIYDGRLLSRMKIKFDYNNIQKELIVTDLLIIVSLTDKNTLSSKLYSNYGRHSDITEKLRTYIMVLEIDYRYGSFPEEDERLNLLMLQKVFNAIGFRYKYLLKNFIRNKFDEVPLYLIKDSKIYKSYQKYLKLNDIEIEENQNGNSTKFYSSIWELPYYNINDIMKPNIYLDSTITELTMKVFNEMKMFSVAKCDLFKYKGGFGRGYNCLRVAQDCLDDDIIEKNYFVEYGIYDETKIKCYLNDKNNLKNNQCGIKYGNLENNYYEYFTPLYKKIKDNPLISMTTIPEINFYKTQKLKLLKNPPSCEVGIPRTIFFSVPPYILDKLNEDNINSTSYNELIEINKNVEYEEIIFEEKDKNYFVTYEAYEEDYKRESVLSVLNYSGVIRSFSDFNTHNLLIKNPGKNKLIEMGMIPFFQKIFSYNNFKVITNKDLTYKYYAQMKKYFPYDYNYMPLSYSYPEEKKAIFNKFKNYKLASDDLWLIKSKLGSLGSNIYIFKDLSNVPEDYIITQYIHNPHLINKLKYDFRLYVLITGLSPLKIYLYKEGMIRFSTEEYSLDLNNIDKLYMHLTNVNINQKNKKTYKKAHEADTEEGSKWSLQVYEKYCLKNGIDYNKIRKQMIDISIKSILAVRDLFLEKIEDNGTKDRNHFKLFGYDFLLDENLKVHLIEVNGRPSLLMGDINDIKLKPQLVADVLNLVGITPYSHDYREDFKAYENENKINNMNKRKEMEYDVNRALCEFGKPRGRFELIFPIKDKIDYYRKFFGKNKKVDEMLWENL